MHNSSLYERNFQILAPFLNEGTKQYLQETRDFDIELVYSKEHSDHISNMKLMGQEFYPIDAAEHAKEQTRLYQKNPTRLFYHDQALDLEKTTNYGPRDASEHIVKAVLANTLEFEETESKNDLQTGYGISFGLGLGLHLLHFVEKNSFQDLVICDGYIDFLQASMNVLDWSSIVELVQSRNGKIHFLFSSNPQHLNLAISAIIQSQHPALIEGIYLYQHHNFGPISEAISRFKESFSQIISYNGWLDDELVQLNNILGNVKAHSHSTLISRPLTHEYSTPTLIIGSGPSLQNDLSIIKKVQNKVTIISSGSSLGILLADGIIPDFHCELENVDILNSAFQALSTKYDLSQISLLASFTINPKVPTYFKDVTFFPREGAGICSMLRGPIPHVPFSGRTATLSALSLALYLKCQNIFLFGLDFAAADDGSTHSPNSIYEMGIPALSNGSGQGDISLRIPGNFQDTVITNSLWTYMRQGVETTIKANTQNPHTQIYNCSNGARIEGAMSLPSVKLENAVSSLPPKPDFNAYIDTNFQSSIIKNLADNLDFSNDIT